MRRCVHRPTCNSTHPQTHTNKHRAGTVGLWPIGTGLVSVWCHCSGTFLCGTRLDLTLHHRLVTHMEVAKTHFLSLMQTHTHTPQQKRRRIKKKQKCIQSYSRPCFYMCMHTVMQKKNSLPCLNVRSNRACSFRLSRWMVQTWS